MKIHRLIGILMYMEAHKNVTAQELACYFEVSERTIYRDIDQLCEAGMPIYGIAGSKGGYSFAEGYHLKSDSLNRSEMEDLLLSVYRLKVNSIRREEEQNQEGELFQKLINEVNDKEKEAVERLFHQTIIDQESWWGTKDVKKKEQSALASNLDHIQKAIYHLKKLRFDYRSYNELTLGRVLLPYGVVEKDGQWYVVGFSEDRNDMRTFHCQRMENICCLKESFQIPNNFDLKEHWKNSVERFRYNSTIPVLERKNSLMQIKPDFRYPVKLEADTNIDKICPGFTRIDSGKAKLSLDMISKEIAFQQLLPYLNRIKILEPQELIVYFQRFIQKARERLE